MRIASQIITINCIQHPDITIRVSILNLLFNSGLELIPCVVGRPDEARTEIVKAFVVPKTDVSAGPDVAEDIKSFVKLRLAAHECPWEVEFISELPVTATGKIMRKELKKLDQHRKSNV